MAVSVPAPEDDHGSSSPTKKRSESALSPQHEQQQHQQHHHRRHHHHREEEPSGSFSDGLKEQSPKSSPLRSPPASTLPRMVPVVSRQLPPGENAPPTSTTADSTRAWKGPGKTTTVVNGLTFRSDFDSGNLMKVLLPEDADGVYQLWTARDCEGGPNTKRNSSWFYFGVAGGSRDQIISMRLMNLNNQNALYKHGMTPVFRLSGNPLWTRLKQKVTFQEEGRHLKLQFQFRFTRDSEEVLFAFCFPHSYEDCERYLESCEDQARRGGMAVQALLTPKPGPTGYYHRELLIRTPEGRRVDLVTVTDCHGIQDERESRIDPHLFPELPWRRRPFKFEGKDTIFVSARVHPGETPASFVFQGILRFLLDSIDPRAAELRRRFVFKMVPLMNPDGVAAGHFRQDSYGNNLNRHYADPHPERHASVYAAKAVVMHYAARPVGRGRLTLYLDLHAHASSRGCFMYGNHLPRLEDQVENQLLPLLMSLNTPHFDFPSCNFTLKHMSRIDSGDGGLSAEGTGRVFYGKKAGVLRSYTLECNYNTGKANCNHIPAASGGKGRGFASPERKATPAPRYHPGVWRDVGVGFLKALLDAEGASVWSRLPQSKFRSLERARRFLTNELRSQPSYREQSLLLRQGASGTPPTLPPPPSAGLRSIVSSPSGMNASANRTSLSRRKSECAMSIAGRAGDSAAPSPGEVATNARGSGPPPLVLPRSAGRTPPAQGSRKAVWKTGFGGGGGGCSGGGGGGGGDAAATVLEIATKTTSSVRERSGSSRTRSGSARPKGGGASTSSCVEGASSSRSSSGRRGHATRGTRRQSPHHPDRSVSRDARRHRSSTRRKRPVVGVQGSRCSGTSGNHARVASSHSEHRMNVSKPSNRFSCRSRSRQRRTLCSPGTPPEAPAQVLQSLPTTVIAGAALTPPVRERRIRQPTKLSLSTRHNKRSGSLQPAPGWELQASS